MLRKSFYSSPIGKLIIISEGEYVKGIGFDHQRQFYRAFSLDSIIKEETGSIVQAKKWLDTYFSGKEPASLECQLAPEGTDFRQKVWNILRQIPYGQTRTYKEIGQMLALKEGKTTFSAQAIGGAVGHNPLSIVIPCHRVVGSNGSLIGYAGGLERKQFLLELEQRR